jgi:hypothetical protein
MNNTCNFNRNEMSAHDVKANSSPRNNGEEQTPVVDKDLQVCDVLL